MKKKNSKFEEMSKWWKWKVRLEWEEGMTQIRVPSKAIVKGDTRIFVALFYEAFD
jgi:hypothetical protein